MWTSYSHFIFSSWVLLGLTLATPNGSIKKTLWQIAIHASEITPSPSPNSVCWTFRCTWVLFDSFWKVVTSPKRNCSSSPTCFSNPLTISKWCSLSSETYVVLIESHTTLAWRWRFECMYLQRYQDSYVNWSEAQITAYFLQQVPAVEKNSTIQIQI